MNEGEHGVEFAQVDLDEAFPDYDWTEFFASEGYTRVWRNKGWVWVPLREVSQ